MDNENKNVTQFRPLRDVTQNAVSTSVQSQPNTCPAEIASQRTAILLACFRKGDAADPETYSAAVAAILSCYPQQVVYRVTDPRSGLPGTSQWLPTAAEVRTACEREMAPARAAALREQRSAEARAIIGEPVRRPEVVRRELARLASICGDGSAFDGAKAEPDVRGLDGETRVSMQKLADAKMAQVLSKYAGKPITIATPEMAQYLARGAIEFARPIPREAAE